MIEVISPAGFEGFFRQLSELVAEGPPPLDALADLAASYGLQVAQPDWLPDLIGRYELNAPPFGP